MQEQVPTFHIALLILWQDRCYPVIMLLFACFRLQNNLSTLTKKCFLRKTDHSNVFTENPISMLAHWYWLIFWFRILTSIFSWHWPLILNIRVQIYIFFQELKLSCSWAEIRSLSCRSISRRFCEFQPLPAIFQVSFIAQVWTQKSVKS